MLVKMGLNVFLTIIICLAVASLSIADLVVKTKNGLVRGAQRQSLNTNMTFYSFSGIPYAKPPIGNLRFSSPEPAKDWIGVRDATVECSVCIQFVTKDVKVAGDEDCLCINVYTPIMPEEEVGITSSPISVMVYIHGGAFQFDSGNYEILGPDKLIEKNVVVVTFNYRLGCLGFLSTGDKYSPGNYGIKDQILALKWVQENVAQFGGNPKSVTIFGESAGAASVAYIAQMQSAQGLFHRAILQSGSTLNPFSFVRKPYKIARNVAIANSVRPTNSEAIVNELRKIDAEEFVLKSAGMILVESIGEQLRSDLKCVPTLEDPSPDSIVTEASYKILKEGRVLDVPYLIGHTSLEGYSFRGLCFLNYPNNLLHGLYTPADTNIPNGELKEQLGAEIRNYYFPENLDCSAKFQRYIGDDYLTRGVLKHIQLLANNNRTVYMYKFSYQGQLGQDIASPDGVGHAGELPYLFRTTKDASPGSSEQDKFVSDGMTQMWVNFANTGNPAPNMKENLPIQSRVAEHLFNYLDISDTIQVKTESIDMMRFWNHVYSFGRLVDTM